MNAINDAEVREYLVRHGRSLDLALYEFHVGKGDSDAVLQELRKYQNDDGGFGHAIEPDLRIPHSSALGTCVAFQFLTEVDAGNEEPSVHSGVDYFVRSFDDELVGWRIIPPEANDYPHAPWWDYERSLKTFGWGNPSAEILGYLIRYRALLEDDSLIDRVLAKAFNRLKEIDEPEFHELLNYMRLYQHVDADVQSALLEPLAELIQRAVVVDPGKWGSYGATPLTFARSPESPFAKLFAQEVLNDNLRFMMNAMIDDSHWEPNWHWGGTYPQAWAQARVEWSSMITVDILLILENHGWWV